jgi:hypothetical protein
MLSGPNLTVGFDEYIEENMAQQSSDGSSSPPKATINCLEILPTLRARLSGWRLVMGCCCLMTTTVCGMGVR